GGLCGDAANPGSRALGCAGRSHRGRDHSRRRGAHRSVRPQTRAFALRAFARSPVISALPPPTKGGCPDPWAAQTGSNVGWILNCRDATRLISRELDGPLPWRRRLLLRLHLAWCDPCRAFTDQVTLLGAAMNRYRS